MAATSAGEAADTNWVGGASVEEAGTKSSGLGSWAYKIDENRPFFGVCLSV